MAHSDARQHSVTNIKQRVNVNDCTRHACDELNLEQFSQTSAVKTENFRYYIANGWYIMGNPYPPVGPSRSDYYQPGHRNEEYCR